MNFFSVSGPHFHILAEEAEELDDYVAKLRFEAGAKTAVRLMRGKKMEEMEGFYDEMSAALQLPLHFGRNLDALDDCLADLDWLYSDGFLFVFADAPLILNATDRQADFFKLLHRNSVEWAKAVALGGGLERKPKPFQIVLQSAKSEANSLLSSLRKLLGDSDLEVDIL